MRNVKFCQRGQIRETGKEKQMERDFPPRTRAKLIKAFPEYHRQKKKTKETLMKQRLNAGNKSW